MSSSCSGLLPGALQRSSTLLSGGKGPSSSAGTMDTASWGVSRASDLRCRRLRRGRETRSRTRGPRLERARPHLLAQLSGELRGVQELSDDRLVHRAAWKAGTTQREGAEEDPTGGR